MGDAMEARRGGWGRVDGVGIALVLVALAIPVVVAVLSRPAAPVAEGAAWESDRDEAGNTRAVAHVIEVVRKMELVTVAVEGTITSSSVDPSWRGTAAARIEAPVRYSFGVDLSGLEEGAMRWDPLLRRYVLTIPRPVLLSSEVDGGRAIHEQISVSGMRMRKLSGQEQMNLAQKGIYEEARRQTLPEAQREEIARLTLEQVHKVVGGILGEEARLMVVYGE